MINWFDMPAEGLSNGGEFEIKELTATENKVYQTPGEVYSKVTVNVEGGGGSSDFTIKTIVKNMTTQEIITSPDLVVEAQPLLYADIVDGDEPYLFMMDGEGSISLCYQDYETSSLIDTVTLKTSYPLKLQRFVVMLGENELNIDDGTFNNTPVDVVNGFNIEEGGTIMLNVLTIS